MYRCHWQRFMALNSLWLEARDRFWEYPPVSLKHGQVLIFDDVNMMHGSKLNNTSSSRTSFDLRFELGAGPVILSAYQK